MPVPVLLFAFANDRQDGTRYLRDLPVERRAIREALRVGDDDGRWEQVVLPDATLEELVATFQNERFRGRIALFHYSGHAGSFGLLLEGANRQSQVAGAGGLAAFLAQQPGLALVCLNGCSTAPQVQRLLDSGVSAVVATATSVLDAVATEFAGHFYRGLAGGAVLRRAFAEATAATQASQQVPGRAWHLDDANAVVAQLAPGFAHHSRKAELESDVVDPSGWPWNLVLSGAAPQAGEWSLGLAAGDPLWGLPPLPDDIARPPADMRSPFRHLLPYRREHASLFAGRGREIRALVERLTGADYPRITLLYGQSGVGKSSLLEAGVLPRLESTHVIRYVRRERERSLVDTLMHQLVVGEPATADGPHDGDDVAEAWRQAEAAHARPLLVVLDQLEEVVSDGKVSELADLAESLVALFRDARRLPNGHLVLSFRKEWLSEVERALEGARLPFGRVRIARLDRDGVLEALKAPAQSPALRKRFALSVTDEVTQMIADDLLADPESPVTPTLQVIEASLWERATTKAPEAPVFDVATYVALSKEGLLLDDFVEKALARIEAQVPEAHASGLALDVLASHCTTLDTATTRSAAELEQDYAHEATRVRALVSEAKGSYLLVEAGTQASALESPPVREAPGATRLAHDTLAPLIRRRLAQSLRPGQRARRVLEGRAIERQTDGHAVLSASDLTLVDAGVGGMRRWTAGEAALVDASRRVQEAERAAAEARRRTMRRLRTAAISAAVLLAAAGGFAWTQAARATAAAARARVLAAVQVAGAAFRSGDGLRAATILAALPDDADSLGGRALAREILARGLPTVVSTFTTALNSSAFSPDGRWVVTASDDGTARIWDAATGHVRDSLVGHGATVRSVAFSTDGRWVVTASWDHTARIWDAATGQVRDSLVGHRDVVSGAAFSTDGRWVVTASWDHTARIWDAATGQVRDSLEGGGDEVWSAAFSPDGRRVVTASDDGTARIWDAATGQVRDSLVGHRAQVTSAAFSPDGRWVVTASSDNTARIWPATWQQLVSELSRPGLCLAVRDWIDVVGVDSATAQRQYDACRRGKR